MAIEKAFAIHAAPGVIYAALERDLASGGGEGFEVLRRDPGHAFDLRVTISGISCWLTYRLDPREDYTEVVAILVPFGLKYVLFRIMTLGLRNQGFEFALVQGLANLKASVEGRESGEMFDDADAEL